MPATSPHSGALKKRSRMVGLPVASVVRGPCDRRSVVADRSAVGTSRSGRQVNGHRSRAMREEYRDRPKAKGPRGLSSDDRPTRQPSRGAAAMMLRWMSLVPEKITPPTLSRRLALQAGLLGVAGGPEDPDGVEAVLDEALGDLELGHRRGRGGVLAPRLQPGVAIDQQPAGLQPDGHVDDPVRDRLELADRLAELLPRPRVLDAAVELAAHRAQGAGEDGAPLELHRRR